MLDILKITAIDLTTKGAGKGGKSTLQIVKNILSAVFVIAGILAVIMIILGGINYTMSQGDPGKVKKAKDSILYGIIGLVVSVSAYAIVQFVMSSIS